jgi:hypothetical protein
LKRQTGAPALANEHQQSSERNKENTIVALIFDLALKIRAGNDSAVAGSSGKCLENFPLRPENFLPRENFLPLETSSSRQTED